MHTDTTCATGHGERLTVPTGWRLEDRRNRFRVIVPNRLAG